MTLLEKRFNFTNFKLILKCWRNFIKFTCLFEFVRNRRKESIYRSGNRNRNIIDVVADRQSNNPVIARTTILKAIEFLIPISTILYLQDIEKDL